jgi:hypothetical protein
VTFPGRFEALENPERVVDHSLAGGGIYPAWSVLGGGEFREKGSEAISGATGKVLEGIGTQEKLFVRLVESRFPEGEDKVVP